MLLSVSARNDSSFTVTFKRCNFNLFVYVLCKNIEHSHNFIRIFSTIFCILILDDGHNCPKPREGKPPLPKPDEYKCLIRAISKSKKLSTVVNQNDVPRIMEGYAKLMKASMDGLKKVKKIKNKSKATG